MEKLNFEETPAPVAAEPAFAYGEIATARQPRKREIPPDCMTVDEYFDGLMEEIHKEYARLLHIDGDFAIVDRILNAKNIKQ